MYDNDGKITGSTKTTFVNLGYTVGSQLRKKDDVKNNMLIFWEIADVGEFGIKISKVVHGVVAADESLCISLDDLHSQYNVLKDKVGYTDVTVDVLHANDCYILKEYIKSKFHKGIYEFFQSMPDLGGDVMYKPVRSALSPGDFKKGEFRIAPISSCMILETVSSRACPAKSIECTMPGTSYRLFIHPTLGSEKCKVCFRFWHVRDNDVSTACNLKLVNHTTKVEPKISLQIFENTKAIHKGEELVYHREVVTHAAPKEGKQQHHMQPLLEERSAKKQRHAE